MEYGVFSFVESLYQTIRAWLSGRSLCIFSFEVNQDSVVRIDAMHKMFSQLGTPSKLRKAVAMPKTGNHVIGSYIKSNDIEGVEREIEKFMLDIGIPPAPQLTDVKVNG